MILNYKDRIIEEPVMRIFKYHAERENEPSAESPTELLCLAEISNVDRYMSSGEVTIHLADGHSITMSQEEFQQIQIQQEV